MEAQGMRGTGDVRGQNIEGVVSEASRIVIVDQHDHHILSEKMKRFIPEQQEVATLRTFLMRFE